MSDLVDRLMREGGWVPLTVWADKSSADRAVFSAVASTWARSRAVEQNGRFTVWGHRMTADQVRAALNREETR